MVIDTSAFIVIVADEPECAAFSQAILAQATRLTSAATLLETTMVVLGRKGESGVIALRAFIRATDIQTIPFTAEQMDIAVEAFRQYGKGRHPAGLNFGDCFAYALAKATGEPLLFKGNDFSRTDIARAV